MRDCVFGENDLEPALRRISGRQANATVDESASQHELSIFSELRLEVGSQKGTVCQLGNASC